MRAGFEAKTENCSSVPSDPPPPVLSSHHSDALIICNLKCGLDFVFVLLCRRHTISGVKPKFQQ